jgi:hypothetical protein
MEINLRDLLSVVALVVSMISAGFAIGFGFYDRFPRIKTKCAYLPPAVEADQPGNPPLLVVEISNHGRRDIYLEYFYIQYGSKRAISYAETHWDADLHGRYRLTENDRYEQLFDPDSDSILRDHEGNEATNIFFQDSLGRRYYPGKAQAALKAYLRAAGDF